MHARPHLNGNEPADFRNTANELRAALKLVEQIMMQVQPLIHGRNYQHMPDETPDERYRRTVAREHDQNRFCEASRKVRDLQNYATEIAMTLMLETTND